MSREREEIRNLREEKVEIMIRKNPLYQVPVYQGNPREKSPGQKLFIRLKEKEFQENLEVEI